MLKSRSALLAIGSVLLALTSLAGAQSAETNWDLQAVNDDGTSAWSGDVPFTVTGVILNNPEIMLDSTFDTGAVAAGTMGAQWQLIIQGVGGDRCGTALWMGQNYQSLPWVSGQTYTESQWTDEMNRLNYTNGDPNTGVQFRQGDLVTVTANVSGAHAGKRNVNEGHSTVETNNFSIAMVTQSYGLPTAPALTVSDLYVPTDDPNYDASYPMFNVARTNGAEYYQGMYIRLDDITLTDDAGWGQSAWGDRLCVATDGEGHSINLRMPLLDLGDAPTGEFSVYGIVNQEASNDGTDGYEVFVTGVVPEPMTLSLLAAGAFGLLRRRRS